MYSVKIPASITNKNLRSGLLGPVNSFTKCGFNSSCLLPDLDVSMCLQFGFYFVVYYYIINSIS